MRAITASARPLTLAVLAAALFLLLPFLPALAQDNGGVTSPDGSLVYEVLIEDGDNATGIQVAEDGRVYYTETEGSVKMWDPATGLVTLVGHLPVAGEWCVACVEPWLGEGGIHGFLLAPDFAETGEIYLSWSPAHSQCEVPASVEGETNAGCYHLSSFIINETVPGRPVLDVTSERTILTWPFSRYPYLRGSAQELIDGSESPHFGWTRLSAHHGGGIDLMPDGSIVISVGDNTLPEASEGYGPRDPRPEKWWRNAERTAQNPEDRRGKLLRVNPDGSAPDDNPWVGVDGYDPYIYAMGIRNPYRAAVDPKTGTVYSGQVGPDAAVDDPMRGPAGQEELNVVYPGGLGTLPDAEVAEPFNGGYPRCIANGLPYHEYDYINDVGSEVELDCEPFHHPVLWYPKTYLNGTDNPWPQLEGGGSTILPHLVYDYDGDGGLPADFDDTLLLFDWSRGWLATVPVNDDGTLDVSPEQVIVRAEGMNGPIDADIGPDGALYVIEHGGYVVPLASRIGRFTCGEPCGNTAPVPLPATAGSTGNPLLWLLIAAALAIPMARRLRVVA